MIDADHYCMLERVVDEALLAHGGDAVTKTGAIAARFLREARVTGQLEHPNIMPVYELGRRDTGKLYCTMKLVRGRTLADALGNCRSLTQRLQLLSHFVDLCNAIAGLRSGHIA